MEDIIYKIKEAELLGRSGSMFPTFRKWEELRKSPSSKKYIICNASEGEIETFKDYHILKTFPLRVIEGINIAISTLGAQKGYIYLNKNYFSEISRVLLPLIGENIEVVEKKGGYIGGEETSVIEAIEGNDPEPRIKPPFPTEKGLWGFPTLVNNVETFYAVERISKGDYQKTKFFSIAGSALNRGVFEFPENTSIKEVLRKTENLPSFDYFLQVGGGACGEVTLPEEMDKPVDRLASIIIYNRKETDPYLLMKKWVDFLLEGNCDKCTPCREGLYRIMEMIRDKNFKEVEEMFFVMEESSLCPLGKVAVTPFRSLLKKVF